jgi:hypothetical protein
MGVAHTRRQPVEEIEGAGLGPTDLVQYREGGAVLTEGLDESPEWNRSRRSPGSLLSED